MSGGWAFSGQPASTASGPALVTLVDGSTFCISATTGNMFVGASMGLFVRDTRILSGWLLEVDGDRLEPLTVVSSDPFQAQYLTRAQPRFGSAESTLLVIRERILGEGMGRSSGCETSAVRRPA